MNIILYKNFKESLKDDLSHIEISGCKLASGGKINKTEENVIEGTDLPPGATASPTFKTRYYSFRMIRLDNTLFQGSLEIDYYNMAISINNSYSMIIVYYKDLNNREENSVNPAFIIYDDDSLNNIQISKGINIFNITFPGIGKDDILCGLNFPQVSSYLEELESIPSGISIKDITDDIEKNSDGDLLGNSRVRVYLEDKCFNSFSDISKENHIKQYIDKFGFYNG